MSLFNWHTFLVYSRKSWVHKVVGVWSSRMSFLSANQQCQSTKEQKKLKKCLHAAVQLNTRKHKTTHMWPYEQVQEDFCWLQKHTELMYQLNINTVFYNGLGLHYCYLAIWMNNETDSFYNSFQLCFHSNFPIFHRSESKQSA